MISNMASAAAYFSIFLLAFNVFTNANRLDERHSFSLTTFDPKGRLDQVERASRATLLGTPVIAVYHNNSFHFAAPQAFPSPFIIDDGTARFAKVSDRIVATHTGIAADGRIVIAAAQRMATEHEFTYDECIPVEELLEEMSLLFQNYTMKAGARPFGCSIMVGSLDNNQLYRLDPSGAIESLGTIAVMGSLSNILDEPVRKILKQYKKSGSNQKTSQSIMLREALGKAIREALKTETELPPILVAEFSKEELSVGRLN
mmetsp:Transcript_39509/g.43706  ORF Transcript_39509/g.43706 Transcript_39509/m.43706 type:complete len:259 (+) Transcript_39509:1-777(+)